VEGEETAMGALHGGNGGGTPPDGGGLPELPPEWGDIIVPDDPSALAAESAIVRRQFRRYNRSRRWRRRLHLAPPKPQLAEAEPSGMGVPLIIMAIAIIAALISLFAVGWPAQRRAATAGRASTPGPASGRSTASTAAGPLASLTLADANGAKVRLTDTMPAVVLLVDGCDCEDLIAATAAAAGPRVTVLAVASRWTARVPVLTPGVADPPSSAPVRRLLDPQGAVRASIPPLAGGMTVAAALIDTDGSAIKVVPSVRSVDDFSADLPRLAD
jgi:hypothetical protein